MAENTENKGRWRVIRWSVLVWGGAALLLLLPLAAMQITGEVSWSKADFAVFGVMLAVVCGAYEFAARVSNKAYRAAVGVAVAAAFFLVWMNLAVGIIGTEDNPANLMFGGVLAIGIVGAAIARFQPHGMVRAVVAVALAQVLVALVALIGDLGAAGSSWPWDILALTGFFSVLWVGSALLFRKAASEKGYGGAL